MYLIFIHKGGCYMNWRIFDEIVASNCSKALTECREYMEKEYSGEYTDEDLWLESQRIIYKRAVKDTLNFIVYLYMV